MYTIVRGRDSGKARELLTTASKIKAVVVSDNPERLREKANRYGIYNVDIHNYYDLIALDPEINSRPILIHNVDKFLEYYFAISGKNIVGFSATLEQETTHFTCPICGKEWDEEVPENWKGFAAQTPLCKDCSKNAINKLQGSRARIEDII